MPPDDERDYEVGYGKPPRHTRFVKGQSGNPRGRPPGAKNLKTLLNKALNELVVVTEQWRASQGQQARGDRHPARQSLGQSRLESHPDPVGDAPRHRGRHRPPLLRSDFHRGRPANHPTDPGAASGREGVSHDERTFAPRIRGDPALGSRLFRRALFLRAQPAGGVLDELAHRGHRRQACRRARRQDPPADHQPAAAPPQILAGLDRLPGLVSGARPLGPDPVRQLCPGSRRQARPRLPQHHDEPVVSADLPDPPGAAPPGGAGVHHHPPGLPARHLDRRRADRARRRPHPDRRSAEAGGGALRGAAQSHQRLVRSTPSTAGSTTSAAAPSSSSCSGCTRTTSSATCSGRSRGRSCAFRRSPKPTRCTRSRRSGDRNASPAGRARRCIPRASRSTPSSTSAGRSANTISPASISNPRPHWAAAWSRRNGSSATARANGRSASTASCRAGIPPTRRPSSAISASARPGV